MAKKKKQIDFYKQTPRALETMRKPENDVLSGLDKFEFLLTQYWKPCAAAAGAVALLIIALIVIFFVRAAADKELRRKFSAAADAETLEKIIRENPEHPSSFPARVRLATIYQSGKSFRKAAAALREIHRSPKADHFLRLQAGMQAACLLEQAGSDREALEAFLELVDSPLTTQPRREEAIFGAARLNLKLRNIAGARKLLARIQYQAQQPSLWVEKCRILQRQLPAINSLAPGKKTPPAALQETVEKR